MAGSSDFKNHVKNDEDKFYSPEQVANILNIKVEKVRRMCRDKEIKAIKTGKFWRIKATWLNDYINERINEENKRLEDNKCREQ